MIDSILGETTYLGSMSGIVDVEAVAAVLEKYQKIRNAQEVDSFRRSGQGSLLPLCPRRRLSRGE
jgi:hypothetical protein